MVFLTVLVDMASSQCYEGYKVRLSSERQTDREKQRETERSSPYLGLHFCQGSLIILFQFILEAGFYQRHLHGLADNAWGCEAPYY